MNPIEVKVALGKETQGTYRYETADENAAVSTLYVREHIFQSGKPSKANRLVVETARRGL